jgi:hypothetical protein
MWYQRFQFKLTVRARRQAESQGTVGDFLGLALIDINLAQEIRQQIKMKRLT